MSAVEREPRTRRRTRTTSSDESVTKRRMVMISLGSDADSEAIRTWLADSAGQGDESRRIREALVAGLQLLPHLQRIDKHLGVLTRIEAHLRDTSRTDARDRSRFGQDSTERDPLTQAEELALAALLDTD